MDINFPIISGAVSSTIFVISALPMLLKACRSKDLKSYSLTSIILSNVGNVVQLQSVSPDILTSEEDDTGLNIDLSPTFGRCPVHYFC